MSRVPKFEVGDPAILEAGEYISMSMRTGKESVIGCVPAQRVTIVARKFLEIRFKDGPGYVYKITPDPINEGDRWYEEHLHKPPKLSDESFTDMVARMNRAKPRAKTSAETS